MSRIGRAVIPIPTGVQVTLGDGVVQVKGKLGTLERTVPPGISLEVGGRAIQVKRSDDSRTQRALHGLTRALVANMVTGVTQGYSRDLEVVGVGYRVEQRGRAVTLYVGYSHRVIFVPPEDVEIKVTGPNAMTVIGINKENVGEVAAKLRAIRPPEPYKGKGIKYANETVRRKAGKTAGK